MTIIETLAKYIYRLSFSSLPKGIVEITKRSLLDTLGCGIFGTTTSEGKKAIAAVKDFDQMNDATIWGCTERASVTSAALVNGITTHSFEYDDCCMETHSGAIVIPATMAVAEKQQVNGMELITAIVAGYEITARIDMGFIPTTASLYGWHPTGICGSFGAAAAAGKLLALDSEELTWALGLAGSYTGGIWACLADGAMSKRYHPGKAAETGVICAYLAKHGFTGPTQILEAAYGGFYKTYVPNLCNLTRVTGDLGKSFAIYKVEPKPYPTCSLIHSTLDAIFQLRKKYEISAKEVKKVTVRVHPLAVSLCHKKKIGTILDSQMSLPYNAAIALLEGKSDAEEYTMDKIRNPIIGGLIEKVDVISDSTLQKLESFVNIRTKNGKVYTNHVVHGRGSAENPLTEEEHVEKFRYLASVVLGKEQIKSIMRLVFNLERLDNINELCQELRA